MTGELTHEQQITPDELQAAFDDLLFRWGQEAPNGTVSTEFLYPNSNQTNRGVKIESQPFVTLGRYDTKEGRRYTFGVVIPHNGVSKDTMIFDDDRVRFESDTYVQTGTDGWEQDKDKGEFSPDEIKEMHSLVTNSGIRNRQGEIQRFYHQRYLQRSRVGKFIARIRQTDSPSYF